MSLGRVWLLFVMVALSRSLLKRDVTAKRRFALFAAAVAVALPAVLTGATPASADEVLNQELVNKMDGSRLTAGGTTDGTQVYSARGTVRDGNIGEAWDFNGTWDPVARLWTATLKTKSGGKCLQPTDSTPARGEIIVIRTCDDSALQRWSLREETKGDDKNRWWVLRPETNLDVAMAVTNIKDDYNLLRLDFSYPSGDRLWAIQPNNSAWW